MRGKTVVITGGTSGIGEVAAETLARKGARIVLVARDKIRSKRLRTVAPGVAHSIYLASSPDVATTPGQYFYKCLPTTPSSQARDDRSALLLWQRSAVLAGLKENGTRPA
jgi:NAD(P)-dependent dehydrogenase (short-subunit alcohol dehydrogenase family)